MRHDLKLHLQLHLVRSKRLTRGMYIPKLTSTLTVLGGSPVGSPSVITITCRQEQTTVAGPQPCQGGSQLPGFLLVQFLAAMSHAAARVNCDSSGLRWGGALCCDFFQAAETDYTFHGTAHLGSVVHQDGLLELGRLRRPSHEGPHHLPVQLRAQRCLQQMET